MMPHPVCAQDEGSLFLRCGFWSQQRPHHLWNSGQVAVSLPPAALLHVLRDKQGLSCLCQANVLVIPGPVPSQAGPLPFLLAFTIGSNHGVLWHQNLEDGIKALPKASQGIAVSLWLLLHKTIVGKTRILFSKAIVRNCCQLFVSIIIKEKP